MSNKIQALMELQRTGAYDYLDKGLTLKIESVVHLYEK